MTMTDPISDLLTRIRNGQMVRKPKIPCPASKIKVAILKVLQAEGYIRGFEIIEDDTCDRIAKLVLPEGSNFSKWKLNPISAKLKTFTF